MFMVQIMLSRRDSTYELNATLNGWQTIGMPVETTSLMLLVRRILLLSIYGVQLFRMKLEAEASSRVGTKDKGFVVAHNSTGNGIENAIGSPQADTLRGNEFDNRLDGDGGDDQISGGEGDDILYGGPGADTLIGGQGRDAFMMSDGINAIHDFYPAQDIVLIPEEEASSINVSVDGSSLVIGDGTHKMVLSEMASAFTTENVADYPFIQSEGEGEGGGGEGEELVYTVIDTNQGEKTLWQSGDGRVWYGTSESDRKAIKESASQEAYYLYEDWGYGYRKAHSLIADGSNYWLVLEENIPVMAGFTRL